MKQEIAIHGKKQILDTDRDLRVYTAHRSSKNDSVAWKRGKDIYYHQEGRIITRKEEIRGSIICIYGPSLPMKWSR